jgi:Fe-S cluster assembly protein SufD
MTTFADSAADLVERSADRPRRRELWAAYVAAGLPTTDDEVWRYAPLSALRLDDFAAGRPTRTDPGDDTVAALTEGAALVLRIVDGELVASERSLPGLSVSTEEPGAALDGVSFEDRYRADAFALLAGALTPGRVVLRVAPGVRVAGPVILVHEVTSRAALPVTRVEHAPGSRVEIVECYLGGADALVAPLGEYLVGDDAELVLSSYQRLATTCWHVARTTAVLGRDARVRQSVVGLGGHYNRARNDAEFVGPGAANELRTTFLGTGRQVHDLRTHQFHKAGRTTSTLLSKGAVADHARSVYTGLIEIEKGARRTDARQRNLNLLLAPTAHADTVPNLDIRENDVACAHASSVGPLDEMQLWYLESRGVERTEAERLLVLGFFNEMTDSMPAAVARLVELDVAGVLARAS